MAGSTLSALLCAVVLANVSGQDFLKHWPKIQPAKIAKQSPAEMAKSAAKTAADAAQMVASRPKEAAEAAKAHVKQAELQKKAVQALDGASGMLKRVAQAASATNASALAKSVQDAADTVLPTGLRPKDIKNASMGDLEGIMREATPKAAETVKRMSHTVAKNIDEMGPRAAKMTDMVDRIADRMFGPIPKGATGLPTEIEDEIRGFGVAPILGILLILVIGGTVVTARLFKRGRVVRSPVLLASGGEPADEYMDGALHMPRTSGGVEFSRF